MLRAVRAILYRTLRYVRGRGGGSGIVSNPKCNDRCGLEITGNSIGSALSVELRRPRRRCECSSPDSLRGRRPSNRKCDTGDVSVSLKEPGGNGHGKASEVPSATASAAGSTPSLDFARTSSAFISILEFLSVTMSISTRQRSPISRPSKPCPCFEMARVSLEVFDRHFRQSRPIDLSSCGRSCACRRRRFPGSCSFDDWLPVLAPGSSCSGGSVGLG